MEEEKKEEQKDYIVYDLKPHDCIIDVQFDFNIKNNKEEQ